MAEKITKDMIINNVIRDFPITLEIFHKFGIDACCGGSKSIEEAARGNGVELQALLSSLNNMTETAKSTLHYEPCFIGKKLGEEQCPNKRRIHAAINRMKEMLAKIFFRYGGTCNLIERR